MNYLKGYAIVIRKRKLARTAAVWRTDCEIETRNNTTRQTDSKWEATGLRSTLRQCSCGSGYALDRGGSSCRDSLSRQLSMGSGRHSLWD